MAIDIRPVQAHDDPALEELFARAFGQPPPAGEWSWKYERNPLGRDGRVAVLDGRVVGHFGAWRTRLWADGVARPALSACDSMTEPGVRARGRDAPFLRMGRSFFDRLEATADETFVFGFPNERARAFGERFVGYRFVQAIPLFTGSCRSLALPPPSGFSLERRETVPESYDELWARIRAEPGWRTDKSRDVLNWRYHQRPHRYYRMFFLEREGRGLAAAAVAGFDGSRGRLVELLAEAAASEGREILLRAVAEDVARDGIETIETWANPERPLAGELARLGFVAGPSGIPLEVRPVRGWPDPAEVAAMFEYVPGDYDVH